MVHLPYQQGGERMWQKNIFIIGLLIWAHLTNTATAFSNRSIPLVANFPLSENFESDGFDPNNWSINKLNNGIVETNTDNPHNGSRNAYLGQKVRGSATAELTLTINLSGVIQMS